jgi:hypothetical protein
MNSSRLISWFGFPWAMSLATASSPSASLFSDSLAL